MRIVIPVLILASFLFSCGDTASSKNLAGADSLVVQFNDPQKNTIINTINTTEPNAIKKIKQFVSGKETDQFKCGYDGNMIFFSKGQPLADISFNYSGEGCKHFMQLLPDGKLSSTAMSNEAANFLRSLAEGKTWY